MSRLRGLFCIMLAILLLCGIGGCTSIPVEAFSEVPEGGSPGEAPQGDWGFPGALFGNAYIGDGLLEEPIGESYHYSVLVCDEEGVPLPGANVALYQHGEYLDTQMADAHGTASWRLAAGNTYSAKASMDGYNVVSNNSRVEGLYGDAFVHITLAGALVEEPEPTAPHESTEAPEAEETPMPMDTPEPKEAQEPIETPIPVDTPEPIEEALEPMVTPLPADVPEPTEMPESAETPQTMNAPEPTQIPESTETPQTMDAPEQTPIAEDAISWMMDTIVSINADDTTVILGDPTFDLMDGVSAADQDGNPVTVSLLDAGGFDVNILGIYTVKYAAMQGSDEIARSRLVRVVLLPEGEPLPEDQLDEPVPEEDFSSELYRERLRMRDKIHARLVQETGRIQATLEESISELLPKSGEVRYLRIEGLEQAAVSSGFAIQKQRYQEADPSSLLNWGEILAVFTAQSGLSINRPMDLLSLGSVSFDGLAGLAVQMTGITTQIGPEGADILIFTRAAEDLGIDADQAALARQLMEPEYQRVFAALLGDQSYHNLSVEQVQQIISSLPEGISRERKDVVVEAQSLMGQISYLWGGKYNHVGRNPNWAIAQNGEAGLDCSGFVSWAFINGYADESVIAQVGNGSANQWAHSSRVDWEDAQPGDLAFIAVPGTREINHVGIVASVEADGTCLIIHCASSRRGVVMTEAWESGFRYIRRPAIFAQ